MTLKDNIISALDDYAEFVVGSDFGGATNQEDTVEYILESIEKHLPKYNSKPSRSYFQANSNPLKAHKNGYRLAIREMQAKCGKKIK